MRETNRLTSVAAVNEVQRQIAREMEDLKQMERTIAATPKRRQVAAMIDDVERTQRERARQTTPGRRDR